jgi:uncharacterized protein YwqG
MDQRKASLARIAPFLESLFAPAIGFALFPKANLQIGISKVGGAPDLPDEFAWPENRGRKLDFLLQVNLAEVGAQDDRHLLPASGILSFFYDLERQPWAYDPADLNGFRVVYTPPNEQLTSWRPPNEDDVLPECAIQWFAMQTLPHFGSRAFDRFSESAQLSDEEREAYDQMVRDMEQAYRPETSSSNHHLLGHSDNVQGDMQLEAQLVTNGLYCGNPTGYRDPRRKTLEAGADDWMLLLQLDSDDSVGFMWGDIGMLYYWIRRDDLEAGCFDKVWMTMQCS